MSLLNQREQAFVRLGDYLQLLSHSLTSGDQKMEWIEKYDSVDSAKLLSAHEQIQKYIEHSANLNPWFTHEFLISSIRSIGESLKAEKIDQWLLNYGDELNLDKPSKIIGVVMAGNLPLVGFHDYLCVLISGHRLLAKLSHADNKLLPLIHDILVAFEPGFLDKAVFTEQTLSAFDAVIATGSSNTARYFEYYFGKYPNIIRKNRNGVAILKGDETQKDLEGLADDVFMYFGLGCRNVSKLFVPRVYDFQKLFSAFEKYKHLTHHYKYVNNYDYNKSIFLVNKIKHLDTGFALLTEELSFSSPISVLYYEYYDRIEDLAKWIDAKKENIQCLMSNESFLNFPVLSFGKAQQPELWDYADGVDTLKFLLEL